MSLNRASTAIELLENALDASFRNYQPYSRALSLQDVMAKVKAHYPDCPLSSYELDACVRTYAIRHSVYDGP